MKNLIKITALFLAALTAQTSASQYQAGPDGLQAACALFMPGQTPQGPIVKKRFSDFYGKSPDVLCNSHVLAVVSTIKTSIEGSPAVPASPGNPGSPAIAPRFNKITNQFTTTTEARSFVNMFLAYDYLFDGNIFSKNYLKIATTQMEQAVDTQTSRGNASEAALRTVAKELDVFSGGSVATAVTEADLVRDIQKSAASISNDEGDMRLFLNGLTLKYDAATRALVDDPVSVIDAAGAPLTPAKVYQTPMTKYAQITFARRLASMMPNFGLLSLINDSAAPLTTKLLSKNLKMPAILPPNFYEQTETQAKAVISAMADQINDTDTALTTAVAALPAGLIPAYITPVAPADVRLAAKTTDLLAYMNGHLATGGGLKTAVEAAFDPLAVRLGLAAPAAGAHVDTATAITNAGTQITSAATALVAVDSLMRAAGSISTHAPATLTLDALAQEAAQTITNANNALTAAAAVAPAVTIPSALTTLVDRINGLTSLLRSSGSAGIQTYITNLVAERKANLTPTPAAVPLVFQTFVPVVSQVRSDLGYGSGSVKDEYEVFAAITEAVSIDGAYMRAGTTETKVKALTDYLIGQLYTSFMWATSDMNTAGTKITAIPAFSGSADNIGKAIADRIKQLNSEIGTLSTENTTLRTTAGGVGAEANPEVIKIVTQVDSLDGILAQCATVHGAAAGSPAQLALVPAAVTEMTLALSSLGGSVLTGLPAKDGGDLASKIRTAVIQLDGEITGAATSIYNLRTFLTPCDGLFTGRKLTNTLGFETAAEQVAIALEQLATNAHLPASTIPASTIPAATGLDLAKAIENAFKAASGTAAAAAATGPIVTALQNLNNNVLGGFIDIPVIAASADATTTEASLLANATTVVQMLQQLAYHASLKAGAAPGTDIPAVVPGAAALTQVDKLKSVDLVTDIQEGISSQTASEIASQILNQAKVTYFPATTLSLNYDDLHVAGFDKTAMTALAKPYDKLSLAGQILRGSLGITIAMYNALGITPTPPATDFADFAALETAMTGEVTRLKAAPAGPAAPAPVAAGFTKADIDTAVATNTTAIAQQLMDLGSGTLRFTAFPAGFNFNELNLNAGVLPDGTNLVTTADFYRQCAIATTCLKILAFGENTTGHSSLYSSIAANDGTDLDPTSLAQLSIHSIEQKIKDADAAGFARGQAAGGGAAVPAAAAPIFTVNQHNQLVNLLRSTLKTPITEEQFNLMVSLNAQATQLGVGAKKFVTTKTDTVGKADKSTLIELTTFAQFNADAGAGYIIGVGKIK